MLLQDLPCTSTEAGHFENLSHRSLRDSLNVKESEAEELQHGNQRNIIAGNANRMEVEASHAENVSRDLTSGNSEFMDDEGSQNENFDVHSTAAPSGEMEIDVDLDVSLHRSLFMRWIVAVILIFNCNGVFFSISFLRKGNLKHFMMPLKSLSTIMKSHL